VNAGRLLAFFFSSFRIFYFVLVVTHRHKPAPKTFLDDCCCLRRVFLRRIFTNTTIRFVIGNDDLGFHFHVGLTGPSTGITTQKVRMYCVPCPAKCHTDYVYCRYEARIQVPWPSLGGIKSTVPGTAKKCFAVPGTAQQSLHTSHYPKNHRLCPINCSVLYGIRSMFCFCETANLIERGKNTINSDTALTRQQLVFHLSVS